MTEVPTFAANVPLWIKRQLANNLPNYFPGRHQSLLREGLLVNLDGTPGEVISLDAHLLRLGNLGYVNDKKDLNCLFRIFIRRNHGERAIVFN